jgi:hypothetical protein
MVKLRPGRKGYYLVSVAAAVDDYFLGGDEAPGHGRRENNAPTPNGRVHPGIR